MNDQSTDDRSMTIPSMPKGRSAAMRCGAFSGDVFSGGFSDFIPLWPWENVCRMAHWKLAKQLGSAKHVLYHGDQTYVICVLGTFHTTVLAQYVWANLLITSLLHLLSREHQCVQFMSAGSGMAEASTSQHCPRSGLKQQGIDLQAKLQIRPHRRCSGRDHPDGINNCKVRFTWGGGTFSRPKP